VRLGPLILYVFPSVGALLLKVAIRRVNEAASFSNCRLWKTRRGDLTAHNSGVIQVESVGHETSSSRTIMVSNQTTAATRLFKFCAVCLSFIKSATGTSLRP
jgi:hypothetical protein